MISAMQPVPAPTPPRQRATLVNSRSRETRRALIRAALRLWGEDDFDAAYEASTAADIAHAAGVSKGTFYFHFANKEDILQEMSSATAQAMIDQIEAGMRRGVPLHPLAEQVMAVMARRIVRAPRAAALRAGSLGFSARAGTVTLTGPRLGAAFEVLVRYGKERGELSAKIDEGEAAAMLTAVTAEAIIRWGAGNRPAAWLQQALHDRVQVVLSGITRMGDKIAEH
jgi:AcrR family transcriptional regulator